MADLDPELLAQMAADKAKALKMVGPPAPTAAETIAAYSKPFIARLGSFWGRLFADATSGMGMQERARAFAKFDTMSGLERFGFLKNRYWPAAEVAPAVRVAPTAKVSEVPMGEMAELHRRPAVAELGPIEGRLFTKAMSGAGAAQRARTLAHMATAPLPERLALYGKDLIPALKGFLKGVPGAALKAAGPVAMGYEAYRMLREKPKEPMRRPPPPGGYPQLSMREPGAVAAAPAPAPVAPVVPKPAVAPAAQQPGWGVRKQFESQFFPPITSAATPEAEATPKVKGIPWWKTFLGGVGEGLQSMRFAGGRGGFRVMGGPTKPPNQMGMLVRILLAQMAEEAAGKRHKETMAHQEAMRRATDAMREKVAQMRAEPEVTETYTPAPEATSPLGRVLERFLGPGKGKSVYKGTAAKMAAWKAAQAALKAAPKPAPAPVPRRTLSRDETIRAIMGQPKK